MSFTINTDGYFIMYSNSLFTIYGNGNGGGGGGGGGIGENGTVVFAAFDQNGLLPGRDIEDGTGSFNIPIGITINDSNATGVAMSNLTQSNIDFFSGNQYSNGYIWTATWSAGSTYNTTPVAMYYGRFIPNGIVFWILDPADNTYQTGASGTFNFPVTFTATSNSTNYR